MSVVCLVSEWLLMLTDYCHKIKGFLADVFTLLSPLPNPVTLVFIKLSGHLT